MKAENMYKVDHQGRKWFRVVGLSRELGCSDQSIYNWLSKGYLDSCRDDNGRMWVSLADGVVIGGGNHGLCKIGRI